MLVSLTFDWCFFVVGTRASDWLKGPVICWSCCKTHSLTHSLNFHSANVFYSCFSFCQAYRQLVCILQSCSCIARVKIFVDWLTSISKYMGAQLCRLSTCPANSDYQILFILQFGSSVCYKQLCTWIKTGQRAFSYAAPAVWNSLPPSLSCLITKVKNITVSASV